MQAHNLGIKILFGFAIGAGSIFFFFYFFLSDPALRTCSVDDFVDRYGSDLVLLLSYGVHRV